MKAVLFVIACLVAAILAAPLSQEQYQFLFVRFVEQYNKNYETNDLFTRFGTFKANLDGIIAHNAANKDTKLAINKFADLSGVEFASMMGLKKLNKSGLYATAPVSRCGKVAAVTPIDWRTKNAVNSIKDQSQCGSCWAFSAVAALEGRWAVAKNQLYDLSEQQLVDCSGSTGNEGCNGGLMDNAFEYYIKNGGACQTKDYPYKATDGSCKKCTPVATVSSYVQVSSADEQITSVASGPISVAVDASDFSWQFYSSGIVKKSSGCAADLDHGVAVVGLGSENGTDFYIVRNSWGGNWGESGYIRIEVGGNVCGIESATSYPVV